MTDSILHELTQYFDVGYFISVILITYLVIKLIFPDCKKGLKQIITIVIGLVLGYFWSKQISYDKLIPTFAFSVISYDYIVKRMLKKLKVDYRHKSENQQDCG